MIFAETTEHDVALPDGRTLHAFETGDPTGELTIVHHGTPGSGLIPAAWAGLADQRSLRLVSYDRPGYGASSRHPGRSVADAATDVAALADALGHDTFYSWGASGGGPHVLACAALLPDRVRAAFTLASIAPYEAEGLDWTAGMGQSNIDEFDAALAGPETLRAFIDAARPEMLATGPDSLIKALESLLPPVDVATLNGDLGEFLFARTVRGLSESTDGWVDDDLAFFKPWGFDLSSITVPVKIAQGRQDLMVPFAHGQWLAEHVPSEEAWLSDEDGHVSIQAKIAGMADWMIAAG
jgi:pimeloyl-ACP methyl ester carboxylesterase